MKKIISLFLCVVIFSVANITATADEETLSKTFTSIFANGKIEETYEYKILNNNEICITNYVWHGFGSVPSLKTLEIPAEIDGKTVTSIGDGVFEYRWALTSVTIPNGVTSIGERAFSCCKSLTSVTIPNSVTSIGWYAFWHCESLTSVTIPNSVTSLGDYAFSSCKSLTSVTIPNGVTSIGDSTFSGCESLTSVTIPNSVTSIGERAFRYCHQLKELTFPTSVESISETCFWNCENLEKVTILNKNAKFLTDKSASQNPVDFDIYGYANSTAFDYAKNRYLTFYDIETKKEYKLVSNNKKLIDMLPKDIGVYEPVSALGLDENGGKTNSQSMIYHEPNTNRKEYQEILKATQDVIKNCKTDLEKAKAIYNYVVYKKYEGKMNFTGNQIESVYSSFKYAWGCMPMTLLTQYMLYLANIPSVQAISDYHTWCLALIDNKWITVDTAMHYFGEEYTNIIPTESHHITEINFNHKNLIYAIENYDNGVVLIGMGRYYSDDEAGYGYSDYKTLIDKHKNITLPKWVKKVYTDAISHAGYKGKITMSNGKVIDCKNIISFQEEDHIHFLGIYDNKLWKVNKRYDEDYYKKNYKIFGVCKYYDNGKITKKPTCSSEGVKTYTCVCGKTKKVKIKKLAHQPTNKRASAKATYFNNGYKNAIVCKKCKEVIKGKTIKKLKLKTPKLTVKAEKKKITVKYAKVKDSSGFELKYTIGKKTCTKTFKTKKSAIKTIKGLKKGSYKVRIRAFVKQGSKTAYSNWSKTKTVKVK